MARTKGPQARMSTYIPKDMAIQKKPSVVEIKPKQKKPKEKASKSGKSTPRMRPKEPKMEEDAKVKEELFIKMEEGLHIHKMEVEGVSETGV